MQAFSGYKLYAASYHRSSALVLYGRPCSPWHCSSIPSAVVTLLLIMSGVVECNPGTASHKVSVKKLTLRPKSIWQSEHPICHPSICHNSWPHQRNTGRPGITWDVDLILSSGCIAQKAYLFSTFTATESWIAPWIGGGLAIIYKFLLDIKVHLGPEILINIFCSAGTTLKIVIIHHCRQPLLLSWPIQWLRFDADMSKHWPKPDQELVNSKECLLNTFTVQAMPFSASQKKYDKYSFNYWDCIYKEISPYI